MPHRRPLRTALLALGSTTAAVLAVTAPPAQAEVRSMPSLLASSPAQGTTVVSPRRLKMFFGTEVSGVLTVLAADGSEIYCGAVSTTRESLACQPPALPDGDYRLRATLSDPYYRWSSGDVSVPFSVGSPAGLTLLDAEQAQPPSSYVTFFGDAPAPAQVVVRAQDQMGTTASGEASREGYPGQWTSGVQLQSLADGLITVTASAPGLPPVSTVVRKDTVPPSVVSASLPPVGDDGLLHWSAVLSEPDVRVQLVLRDHLGSEHYTDDVPGSAISDADGTVIGRALVVNVHSFPDGPLQARLLLTDRAGRTATVPIGTVQQSYVPPIELTRRRLLAGGLDVGAPVGAQQSVNCVDYPCPNPGGDLRWQVFQQAEIWTWDDGSGSQPAYEVHGAILDVFRAHRGIPSRWTLGYPTSDEEAAGAGRVSHFSRGDVLWSPATGAYAVTDSLGAAYTSLGGPAGVLGFPVSSDETGSQSFQGGRLWPATSTLPARAVYGGIYDAYRAANGPVTLGLPLASEQDAPGGGRMSVFERGRVYWSATTGAHAVYGAIGSTYLGLGGPAALGLPTTDELDQTWPGRVFGRVSVFQRGRVYWTPQYGAHAVYGAILGKYLDQWNTPALLGPVVSDEHDVQGGRASDFRDGRIYWSSTSGAHEAHGGILATYLQLGGPDSRLGLPTTDEYSFRGEARSDFQHGQIRWTSSGPVVSYR